MTDFSYPNLNRSTLLATGASVLAAQPIAQSIDGSEQDGHIVRRNA